MENYITKLINILGYERSEIIDVLTLKILHMSKSTGEALYCFEAYEPVDTELISDFTSFIKDHPFGGAKSVNFDITYSTYNAKQVYDYYRFLTEVLSNEQKRLSSCCDYKLIYNDQIDELLIDVPSEQSYFTFYKNELLGLFRKFGFKNINLNLNIVSSDDTFIKEQIEKEQNTFREQIVLPKEDEKESEEVLNPLREFKGVKKNISDLPDSEEEFYDFKSKSRFWSFTISGEIVAFDPEKVPKDKKVSLVLRDNTGYIYCTKGNLKTADEIFYFIDLAIGQIATVEGYPRLNKAGDVTFEIVNFKHTAKGKPVTDREDNSPVKRVELHTHTLMSSLDGVPKPEEYYKIAKKFGHKAVALTDRGNVQAYHDLYGAAEKDEYSVKPIYGLELAFIDDKNIKIAHNKQHIALADATYVVFDIETTSLSATYEKIMEIGAVKVQHGLVIDTFSELIDVEREIHPAVVELTGIRNSDLVGKRKTREVLIDFLEFIKGSILVAHNAAFDICHLYKNFDDLGLDYEPFPSIDTLVLAKVLYPSHKRYTLDALCKLLDVTLENHHRATDDAKACSDIYQHMIEDLKDKGVLYHDEIDSLIDPSTLHKLHFANHINLLVKDQKGFKNLYHILSLASTKYFFDEPILLRSVLEKYRDGLLVCSGCRNSYFFDTALNKTDKELEKIIDFYDVIELQPISSFEYYKNHMMNAKYCIEDTMKRIIAMAKRHSKVVCATGDVHQLNKEDTIYREVLVATLPTGGKRKHALKNEKMIPDEYFMTTEEMLKEFSFLGEGLSYEIVVTNTNAVADSIDLCKPFFNTLLPPKDDFMSKYGIPSAEGYVIDMVKTKSREIYGQLLPRIVEDRVNSEMESILENKFSAIYLISSKLVEKSREDGYVVGSRGSVGSSLVAFLMNITEVNCLPPHYLCHKCHYSSFKMNPFEKEKYGVRDDEKCFQDVLNKTLDGYDLPDAVCPVCGAPLDKDGHDIPFETFLGVREDPKTPDIDLNFSGENQGIIHNYVREIFGENKAFRAGTILTCKDKTAFAMVKDFFNPEKNDNIKPEYQYSPRKAEIEAIAAKITGSKKTTSQHPGGVVVVPEDHEIYEVTPYQYPGDSSDTSWMTTHFEYHNFESNLFKLDCLGQDDPSVIRLLMKYVHARPSEFPFDSEYNIPVKDPKVYQLMNNTSCINVLPSDIDCNVATYGISEFGTSYVRGMLEEIHPKTFSDLIKISGLSHGTDVWQGNARELFLGNISEYGKLPFDDIISCRDDIMINLMNYGVPSALAFKIMEFVRKGKAAKPKEAAKWEKFKEELYKYNLPNWLVWNLSKIQYMFPKAHATAYTMMALRIAWFKIYKPVYFYAAVMSKKKMQFDVDSLAAGYSDVKRTLQELKGKSSFEITAKEEDLKVSLELALEALARGITFYQVNMKYSDAYDFVVSEDGKGLYIPFIAVDSLGGACAESIVKARSEHEFSTQKDFMERTQTNKKIFDKLKEIGFFEGLPEDNQLTLDLGI